MAKLARSQLRTSRGGKLLEEVITELGKIEVNDSVDFVKRSATLIKEALRMKRYEMEDGTKGLPESVLIRLLIQSVSKPGFLNVYKNHIFREEDFVDDG
jgi:hypothetical protein